MTSEEIVRSLLAALNDLEIPYMLTGSLASNAWGVARSTKDADVVVEHSGFRVHELVDRLGAGFQLEPQMSFETVTATQRYVIRVPGHLYKIELFFLSDDPHDRERFKRRMRTRVGEQNVWVASPEDVVVTKLRWSRQGKRAKDLDDATKVIGVQAGSLDWDYIRHWCGQHGTLELLEQVRRSIPPM